jgi:DNA polymerase I
MSRWVLDAECDGFYNEATRMWILAAFNLESQKMHYWLEGDLSWQEEFNKADLVIGHNILGYDKPIFKKLFDYEFPETCTIHDTLIMSLVLDYRRFGSEGHSLKQWGIHFGQYKQEHEDWSQYSENMKNRCISDVSLTVRVYHQLIFEILKLAEKAPQIKDYLRAEHAVQEWSTRATVHGWPFDVQAARALNEKLEDEMNKAYAQLVPKLGMKAVPLDKRLGEVEWKKPRWTKAGFYEARMCEYFEIDPCSGFEGEERPILGPYSRVKFEPLRLDSVADVKIFLFRNGWIPTEWNYKKDENNKKIRSSPKITEDSLEFLGGDGELYKNFAVARSRHSILKTWLENVDSDGNLHGDCFTIGTPSMRSRHSLIVNIPRASSTWGKEMRSLFIAKPGWKLIGADSAGNQARGLAHYINNANYTYILLNEDIHTHNANILNELALEMDEIWNKSPKEQREGAKRVLYAFLFGAAGPKLWSYMFGVPDEAKGKKLKNGFVKAVPGFKDLLKKLENIYTKTKEYSDGYIPGIAGNRIYVDSYHKLLVYLLQACEKATCAAALMLTMQRLDAAGIPYIPCIFYHDEIDFMVPEEHAEEAAKISKQAFIDGPKLFGITIMDGDAKIGDNWYEVH